MLSGCRRPRLHFRYITLHFTSGTYFKVPELYCTVHVQEAVKDNEFIYHERLPDPDSLEPVAPAPVVKATPLPGR